MGIKAVCYFGVGFAICSYLKTQGPLVASLGLSLLLRSLTTERRRSSLKSLLPDGKNLGFSRQTPVFPGFAGVLETRQNPGKQGGNVRNTQETRRCNPAETGRVIGKTRVNPGMGKPKPPPNTQLFVFFVCLFELANAQGTPCALGCASLMLLKMIEGPWSTEVAI